MPRETETIKLLKTLLGLYRPGGDEILRLAEVAKLNKLYLTYLRRVGDVLRGELVREEARYGWFMENAAEVVEVLGGVGATYALYKFRRPLEHVSVDLDILVDGKDIPRVAKSLRGRGFRVVVLEPYTITLERGGFVVDLYTEPSFAWVVYMDGGRLLREHVEDIGIRGVGARALSREAEVAVAAAHAVYKEHVVLLIDCLTVWSWLSREVWGLAVDYGVEEALEELLRVCSLVRSGVEEAPCKLRPRAVLRAYVEKTMHDPSFRSTLPNILRYVITRRDIGEKIIARINRRSY
jgi:hypothetical protein